MLQAAISSDIDTLASIYQGYGCRRPKGYTYTEFRMGLENFSRFLEPYGINSTLFMVGNDFRQPENIPYIKSMVAEGHEIANHTMTHAQGFRLLSPEQKEAEISGMEEICRQVIGQRPVGFRSPGWNMGDDAIPILKRRGYLYDSSIHPTLLMPLLKFLHWWSTSDRLGGDRTTMGHLYYMLAPRYPYHTTANRLGRRGQDGLVEIPLTVMPFVRLPFWATFLLATGLEFFKFCYRLLKAMEIPIQYQFHLSDFVDYGHPELADQLPNKSGVYVPQALKVPLKQKWGLFARAMDIIAADYTFTTLENWASRLS
ncbi:polysaccharide deacetylase family protein [Chloroflexota bacterium]